MSAEAQTLMEAIRAAFRVEAGDLLAELKNALSDLETQPDDTQALQRVCRGMHTIRGTAAAVEYSRLAAFVQPFEAVMDSARHGRIGISPQLIDVSQKFLDRIRQIIDEADGTPCAQDASLATEPLLQALRQLDKPATAPAPDPAAAALAGRREYFIQCRLATAQDQQGVGLVQLLNRLQSLGEARLKGAVKEMSFQGRPDDREARLWWNLHLAGACDEAQIRELFQASSPPVDWRAEEIVHADLPVLERARYFPAVMLQDFHEDAGEHLAQVEKCILELEKSPDNRDVIDELFRSIHSIKGNAGLLVSAAREPLPEPNVLQALRLVAHAAETHLEDIRAARTPAHTPRSVENLFPIFDVLKNLTLAFLQDQPPPDLAEDLLLGFGIDPEALRPGPIRRPPPAAPAALRRDAFHHLASQTLAMLRGCWAEEDRDGFTARENLQIYARGLANLAAAAARLPHPELGSVVAQQQALLEPALARAEPLPDAALCELRRLFLATETLASLAPDLTPPGEEEEPTTAPAGTRKPDRAAGSATLRVEEEKIDRIMRVAGELLIARGALPLLAQRLLAEHNPVGGELKDVAASIGRIADELQAAVMAVRMLPVKTLFLRYPRLVRDLARESGKKVRLVMHGEDTEINKTMLEQLHDPLVHLLRNSVDHGIERPDDRQAAGKPAEGTVTLSAANESGMVVIAVADDGRGLQAKKLKHKAVEKGLLTAEAAERLSDQDAYDLVFLPGFSTADKVTDVSGRGVGMDIVRSNVQNLRGGIAITSAVGQGTQIRLKLPTSLMIAQTLLVQAGGGEYLLPMVNVSTLVKIPRAQLHEIQSQRMAMVRGRVFPLLVLGDALQNLGAAAVAATAESDTQDAALALLRSGADECAVLVDRFVSQEQVVVKRLDGLASAPIFQGASIMGDGRIVLVINPAELLAGQTREPVGMDHE